MNFKTFKWANDIQFDELEVITDSSRFYVTPYGNFPSMTTILKILDDGGIEAWKKRIGKEEAEKVLKAATDRGDVLHKYNELYLKNQLDRSEMHGDGRILFNRIKQYLDKIDVVIAVEACLYHQDDCYAGRVDAIGLIGDYLYIIDHKNSRKPIDLNTKWGRRKLFKYQLQCCGYARCLERMKGIKATKGKIIVANYETMNSDEFTFDLDFLMPEFQLLLDAYRGKADIKKSLYFSL